MCKNVIAEKANANEIDLITGGDSIPAKAKKRLKHSPKKRFAQPAKAEAGHGYADLTRRKVGIQIVLHRS